MEKESNGVVRDDYAIEEIEKTLNDYNLVSGAYRTDLEIALKERTATYEEAMDWYYSIDPVNEKLYIDILRSYKFNDDELALLTMSQSVYRPLLMIAVGQLSINYLVGNNEKLSDSDFISDKNLLYFYNLVDNINIPSSEEDLSKLITTTHIYLEAIDLIERNRQIGEGSLPKELSPNIHILAHTAMELLDKSLVACALDVSRGDYKFLDLAMSAYMERSSHLFAHSAITNGEEQKSIKKQAFRTLLDAIEIYFLSNTSPGLNVPNNKGPLHEALWMLDTSFLFSTSKNFLNDAYISPSLQRMDRPVIGKPRVNRGIDMAISLRTTNKYGMRDTHYVQLKSRGNRLGTYHPSITLIGEKNFDVDKSNLENKINLYRSWIDSDFDETNTNELSKLTLESASNYVNELEKELPYTLKQRIIKRLGGITLYAFGFTDPVLDYLIEKMKPDLSV